MRVPAITVDDMRDFHQRHFPTASAPADFLSHQQARHEEPSHVADNLTEAPAVTEDYEDDGLGYYEDGVERTLTDDEISIFRHSEVQRLYAQLLEHASEAAERRLTELEAKSKSNEPSEEGEYEPQSDPAAATTVVEKAEEEKSVENANPSIKQENQRIQGSERRLSPQVASNDAPPYNNGPKKRKRSDESEHHTFRRIAREMDDVKAVDVELDY
ncbi:uncharacterized protein J3D65DRAFT_665392 [Phyllosticta citribraziliensis]|uniref:Uncharacterized protein n=1 Tax=Phyllosticta citribraziliensis TaxID=989973 RepID=A0ABR1M0W8_9PEZI